MADMTIAKTQSPEISMTVGRGLEARVGDTPMFRLSRIAASMPNQVNILAKAEWFNPSGSVKDRAAINIIRHALLNGDLGHGKRLLDSTSGNMGIAYATIGANLGVPVTLCVPGSASPERIMILKALGAEVILTDGSEGSDGAIREARALARSHPDRYWYANQYDNPANWQAHYMTTGPEVLSQTNGEVTHLVAGLGTSGTLVGTGRYLHEHLEHVEVIGVQPDEPFHGLEGLKHMPTAIKPAIFDQTVADRILEVRTEDAHQMVRRLAKEEGLFVGISSGAAVVAAMRLASGLKEANIVAMLPDAGYKYLSDKELWEGA
jgi:S-sulfo-L-cysteine synthase (O-acetyl-L-serine-dependent)